MSIYTHEWKDSFGFWWRLRLYRDGFCDVHQFRNNDRPHGFICHSHFCIACALSSFDQGTHPVQLSLF